MANGHKKVPKIDILHLKKKPPRNTSHFKHLYFNTTKYSWLCTNIFIAYVYRNKYFVTLSNTFQNVSFLSRWDNSRIRLFLSTSWLISVPQVLGKLINKWWDKVLSFKLPLPEKVFSNEAINPIYHVWVDHKLKLWTPEPRFSGLV